MRSDPSELRRLILNAASVNKDPKTDEERDPISRRALLLAFDEAIATDVAGSWASRPGTPRLDRR